MKSHTRDIGYLPAMSVGMLVVLVGVWAALHDLARDGSGVSECIVLAGSVVGFGYVYGLGLRYLERRERAWWLCGVLLVVGLYDVGAVAAMMRPRYSADALVGALFLGVGIPVAGVVAMDLRRSLREETAS